MRAFAIAYAWLAPPTSPVRLFLPDNLPPPLIGWGCDFDRTPAHVVAGLHFSGLPRATVSGGLMQPWTVDWTEGSRADAAAARASGCTAAIWLLQKGSDPPPLRKRGTHRALAVKTDAPFTAY